MLRSLKEIEKYQLNATDGDLGTVADFFLDDEHWAIRYLVVDTGGFLEGRQVLISPISFRRADWATRCFHLALTMDRIRNSPSVDMARPVSRQHERDYHRYYGYPTYWGSSGIWRLDSEPSALAMLSWDETMDAASGEPADDVHLRSVGELRGYRIQGTDDDIGHVDDFIVDDVTWEVRYLVLDTSNWWFGKKVLVAPRWAKDISWEERKVTVGLSREAIENSPEWDPSAEVNRDYETRLYDHYGRRAYWLRGGPADSEPAPPGAKPRPEPAEPDIR